MLALLTQQKPIERRAFDLLFNIAATLAVLVLALVIHTDGERNALGVSKPAEPLDVFVAPRLFPFGVLALVGGK